MSDIVTITDERIDVVELGVPGPPGAAGASLAGRLLIVDQVNGDDATGTRGRLDRPFLTPPAAQGAAQSGDCTTAYPGTYALAAALGADGRHWELLAGVSFAAANAAPTAVSVFSDGGSPMAFRVTGSGRLTLTGTTDGVNVPSCVASGNAASDITVQADRLTDATTGGGGTAVWNNGGRLTVAANVIETTGGLGVYWSLGDCRIRVRDITATTGTPVEAVSTSAAAGDLFVTAERIAATAPTLGAIYASGPDAAAKTWVLVGLLDGGTGQAIKQNNGKLYVVAEKVASTGGGVLVSGSGSQLWLTTQKITATAGTSITVSGGTVRITCQQIEDLGSLTRAVNVTGGTLYLYGATINSAVGDGVVCSAGTVHLYDCTITTPGGKNDLVQSGTGVIVVHPGCSGSNADGSFKVTGTVTYTPQRTDAAASPTFAGVTLTAPFFVNVNGAVSAPAGSLTGTWFSGGSATTTKPQLLLEPTGTTSTGWSTSGTGLGVNAAAGFVGNLLDVQVAGASKAKLTAAGNLTFGGAFTLGNSANHFLMSTNGVVELYTANGTGDFSSKDLGPFVTQWHLAFSTDCHNTNGDVGIKRGAAGVLTLTNALTGAGTLSSPAVSPTVLAADQNDYAPGVARFLRLATNGAGARNITGLVAGIDGQELTAFNVGTDNIVLKHQSASSAIANRFLCDSGADVTLGANARAVLVYDATAARWRVK